MTELQYILGWFVCVWGCGCIMGLVVEILMSDDNLPLKPSMLTNAAEVK